jgi:Protein of unknown function (DUF3237)
MTPHRTSFVDRALLYLFSADVEFSLSTEVIGLVSGGIRLNISCVAEASYVYNILRQRSVKLRGYSTVTGTVVWGEDPVLLREDDVAVPDVRATIETDDGVFVDMNYRGALPLGVGGFRAIAAASDQIGTLEEPAEVRLVVTPTYVVGSDPQLANGRESGPDRVSYSWLSDYQCVGFGRNAVVQGISKRVSYDIYAMV